MEDRKDNFDEEVQREDDADYVESEEAEEIETEERLQDKLKSFREKVRTLETEKADLLENLQRTKADFLNSKRRIEEQSLRTGERQVDAFLGNILPLVDGFEHALLDTTSLDPKWREGILGIQSILMSLLKRYDVTEIETLGKQFNPHEHEALANIPVDDPEKQDTIISVLQKGYKRNDVVIRPAKVGVGVAQEN